METLRDDDLPGFWRAADRASLIGQQWTLRLTIIRIFGLLLAASGGMFVALLEESVVIPAVMVIGFVVALAAEIIAWVSHPERDWYSGRALAESAKTLAWRFAVAGEPFSSNMSDTEAERILETRLDEVSREARDRVTVEPEGAVVTRGMKMIRGLTFHERRNIYVNGRLDEQHTWYVKKAKSSRIHATAWRIALIVAEILALVLAIFQTIQPWSLNTAGLAATVIAAASSWIAMKQYSTLASAYSVTATELALLKRRVMSADEKMWSNVVDDAEEAISREHTLWLASRTGKAPISPLRSHRD